MMACLIVYICVPKVLPLLIGLIELEWNFKKAQKCYPCIYLGKLRKARLKY
jgi:hypothetical protein